MTDAEPDGPPRSLLIAALVIAALAVVGLLAVAAVRHTPDRPRPVAVASIPAPQADGDACRALAEALPTDLGDYRRATLADPAPAGAAAWQAEDRPDDAVILRCGLERPVDFVAGTPVQVVDQVSWFRIADTGRSTWITVDRPSYVALTLPDGSGPTPIQEISTAVARAMPAVPPNPGPPR
ncbi:DUF3515 domain-containing protein [Mycolicibacterium sediminis]|uniref:Membrane protein n=1 Tax=Mycolicibacterium sediminis TaxID=1286180 RepID=A0A7I7QSM5_9MYCO|nr:DUF3515 domain-containing protein [Mycolicibacterium sediminis]BBY29255.1 membrane protein [Mycolicibacterium sediminis]